MDKLLESIKTYKSPKGTYYTWKDNCLIISNNIRGGGGIKGLCENYIRCEMTIKTHKEKLELLKINKIKGRSKCTNHQQYNKLLMSY